MTDPGRPVVTPIGDGRWQWRCNAPFHTRRPRTGPPNGYTTAAEAWEAAHHHAGHHAIKTPKPGVPK